MHYSVRINPRWLIKFEITKTVIDTIRKMSSVLPKLLPLFDRVLIRKAEAVAKTKGGLLIPEEAQAKVLKGIVVAVGPGARNQNGEHVPVSVKVGDNVLLPEYGGKKIIGGDDNEEMHIYKESELLAKVEM